MYKWKMMREAIQEAEDTLKAADSVSWKMAELLVGRLKTINTHTGTEALCSLKRELRNFNITTRTWK